MCDEDRDVAPNIPEEDRITATFDFPEPPEGEYITEDTDMDS